MLTPSRFRASFDIAASLYSAEASPSKKYDNASGHKFCFDINRTCNKKESKNMSFSNYITAKQNTLARYLGTGGNSGSGSGSSNPITDGKYFISGDMNGWTDTYTDAYALKSMGDGTYTITLTSSMATDVYNGAYRIKFKIRDTVGGWYDFSIVDKNCTVNYDDNAGKNNGNKNFYLAPGTYLVTLDTNTMTIYIEKK
jgi:hypothetical protein